ncbi:MAG: hypothetical protein JKY31_07800 [Rhodobacteraceae bacterium]|nr:hypothetical protein [Paracoccaceae bacterium]
MDALFATLQSESDGSAEGEIVLIFRQSGSDAMDLLLSRGYDAMASGDPRMSIWHLSALIDHAPDFAEAYNARASAFFDLGEYGLAMNDIHVVLSLNPRHFVALAGLGVIQEDLGHLEEALIAYKMVRSLNPHFNSIDLSIERVESQLSILH